MKTIDLTGNDLVTLKNGDIEVDINYVDPNRYRSEMKKHPSDSPTYFGHVLKLFIAGWRNVEFKKNGKTNSTLSVENLAAFAKMYPVFAVNIARYGQDINSFLDDEFVEKVREDVQKNSSGQLTTE